MRRACLEPVGVFDENPDFFAVEDYDLFLRVAAKFSVIYVPGDAAAMRRHSQSISRDASARDQPGLGHQFTSGAPSSKRWSAPVGPQSGQPDWGPHICPGRRTRSKAGVARE